MNSGLSYLIKTVTGGKGVLLGCFFQFVSMNEGHLTNKDHLPVTKINFSGLGQHSEQPRKVKFQLGPLFCVLLPRLSHFYWQIPAESIKEGILETKTDYSAKDLLFLAWVAFCVITFEPNMI